ncbi:MAG: DUF1992 domain-containing protein [Desulfobacteraceae bacterium]|nr:DUF1992 domain-containing protein [Desulfobacteraceae bacterium]
MIPGFEKIVEERIRDSQRKGEFKDLPGTGEPIRLTDDQHIPEDLRLAHKILKNADFVPPEIEVLKDIRRTEDLLSETKDTALKYRALKKLNYLVMKVNMLRKTSIDLELPQRYMDRVVDKLDP